MIKQLLMVVGALLVGSCGQDENAQKDQIPIIRGLKTVLVKNQERTTERKYPGVLQPSSISTLSFEISGKLSRIDLAVGQLVKKGEIIARIDPKSLQIQVDSAKAAVRLAQSSARTAIDDNKRKQTLFKKGVVARAAADQARNAAETASAQLVQAKKALDSAKENLTKTELKAPFDGIINTVEVKSFANVSAGASIATLYSAKGFEASFSVSYDVINLMAVGKKAKVRLADDPSIVLKAHVSELGARADTVSSFPVVIKLDSTTPRLKAGMAIEISLSFPVPKGKGFLLPLTILSFESDISPAKSPQETDTGYVYVLDEKSSTVKRRKITIAGIRENSLIVIDGLKQGERVASAGVSFLHAGQKVRLLPDVGAE
jgi:RND family efflux transporter MFP subunit